MLLEPDSRDVIVVAGLPGAGKTTLTAAEPRALDSDRVRAAWAPRLRGIPYPLWRPLVHAWHWLALWRALARPEGVVVVRPFSAGWMRRAVLRRARRHHPAVHLVVVAATPEQARAGQATRGRAVGDRAMRRHERRWAAAEPAGEGWTSVLVAARSLATPSPLSAAAARTTAAARTRASTPRASRRQLARSASRLGRIRIAAYGDPHGRDP